MWVIEIQVLNHSGGIKYDWAILKHFETRPEAAKALKRIKEKGFPNHKHRVVNYKQKGGCSHSIVVDADYKGDGSPDIEFNPDGQYRTAEWPPQSPPN